MTAAVDAARLWRFAVEQGPGKRLLGEQRPIDDTVPTSSCLPPPFAHGGTGVPLPTGTAELLDRVPFGRAGERPADPLGHALAGALGLQRREPGPAGADHRAMPSGRGRYPVHAFVAHEDVLRYLDVYRHALVDVPAAARAGTGGGSTVLLAARYTDLPANYGRLRLAVCEIELGVALRAVCALGEAVGLTARVTVTGRRLARRGRLLAAAGAGHWSMPVALELADAPVQRSVPLDGGGGDGAGGAAGAGALLRADPGLAELLALRGLRAAAPPPARGGAIRGAPAAAGAAPRPGAPSWAAVLWARSAGRAPGGRYGMSLVPAPVPAEVLADLLGWYRVPFPDAAVRAVAGAVRTTVVPAGDPVLRELEAGFGRPSSPTTDLGLRHAGAVVVQSVDLRALIDRFGPVGWALLQLHCGWSAHGLCLAAAAHGLVARPARSFDEYVIGPALGLDRREVPVFMTVCGRPRGTAPMLDLRP